MSLAVRGLRARGVSGPIDLMLISPGSAAATFTSLAAAPTVTDYNIVARKYLDLRYVLKWSCSGVIGSGALAGAVLGFQYSLDAGSTWFWMDGTDGSAPPASMNPVFELSPNLAVKASPVIPVPAAARTANTLMRLAATNGNGSASPALRLITLTAVELIL